MSERRTPSRSRRDFGRIFFWIPAVVVAMAGLIVGCSDRDQPTENTGGLAPVAPKGQPPGGTISLDPEAPSVPPAANKDTGTPTTPP